MHLAEGVLPLDQAIGWSVLAVPVVTWSIRGSQKESAPPPITMAGVTSILFAATLLPLPVPALGATSHICLTPILALLVGVRNVIWPTFFVLLLQAIFFAHGGLTTLGINTLTLGVLGPLTAVGIWRLLQKFDVANGLGLAFACGAGDLGVYVADAVVLAFGLSDAVAPSTTFVTVLLGFAPVQIPLSVLEAFASLGIVRALATRRPDLLPESLRSVRKMPFSMSSLTMILLLATAPLGCSYQGIDGTVFGATAEKSGRPPTASLIDFSQGEVGLAMTIIILFGLGFAAGRGWERFFGRGRHAL